MDDKEQIDYLYKRFKESKGVSTDSRKIEKGMLYFALRGENFDGNKFAFSALEKGASLAIVDDPSIKGENIFSVNNSLQTLQKLASFTRSKWNFPVFAIAGSNGKTTTKELVADVLSKKYNVFSTPGNYNNHIGLPLTLLMVPDNCNFLVLEIGANHLGEHEFLCSIAEPNCGLVTNNGKDHLEGYGSLENVIRSNAELYEYLKAKNGNIFINSDDPQLMKSAKGGQLNRYGFQNPTDFKASISHKDLFAGIHTDFGQIDSNLVGMFNNMNILAAAAIGNYYGINFSEIKNAIETYEPKLNRSQLLDFNNFKVMLDAYNANPSSMDLALKTIEKSSYTKKMAILGGMLELGYYEEKEHQNIIQKLKSLNFDLVWLIGKEFENYKNEFEWFSSLETCKGKFKNLDFSNGIVLIKGSRKYQLEKLIE